MFFDDNDDKVLECLHPHCRKRSCVACRVEVRRGRVHRCEPLENAPDTQLEKKKLFLDFVFAAFYEKKQKGGELLRSCPSPTCDATFLKETGCNRLRCPTCDTYSCYLCRKQVTDYSHFCLCDCDLTAGHITRKRNAKGPKERCHICGKCSLWHDEGNKIPPAAHIDDDLLPYEHQRIQPVPPPPPLAAPVPPKNNDFFAALAAATIPSLSFDCCFDEEASSS